MVVAGGSGIQGYLQLCSKLKTNLGGHMPRSYALCFPGGIGCLGDLQSFLTSAFSRVRAEHYGSRSKVNSHNLFPGAAPNSKQSRGIPPCLVLSRAYLSHSSFHPGGISEPTLGHLPVTRQVLDLSWTLHWLHCKITISLRLLGLLIELVSWREKLNFPHCCWSQWFPPVAF